MKKRFIKIILVLCMLLTMLPAPASVVTVNAYFRVVQFEAKFSSYPDAEPSGIIPYGTNLEIQSIDGDYAKFGYKGFM